MVKELLNEMANKEHLVLLKQGVDRWNAWRTENFGLEPDLKGADLSGADLDGVDLLWGNLSRADLSGANLRGANLSRADLSRVDLSGANLRGANLNGADFRGANLRRANLGGANLRGANLRYSLLSGTNLENANLTDCLIYGISTWNLKLEGANQSNLIVTPAKELVISVDNLEVALFISLLLDSHKLRNIVYNIRAKIVLILGCFTSERQVILDSIQEALRSLDYLPVTINFDKPARRNLTETISCVASIARFVIADLTNSNSILQELQNIVPHLPLVPVQPLLYTLAETKDVMVESFQQYPWVLETYQYNSLEQAIAPLSRNIIVPAEAKAKELLGCNKAS